MQKLVAISAMVAAMIASLAAASAAEIKVLSGGAFRQVLLAIIPDVQYAH